VRVRIAFALLAALAACSENDDIPAPVLSSVTPDHAGAGAVVMLSGAYLCQQPEGSGDDTDPLACANTGLVDFDRVPGTASQYTDTSITVQVPDLTAGDVQVSISVAGRTSNSVDFTVD